MNQDQNKTDLPDPQFDSEMTEFMLEFMSARMAEPQTSDLIKTSVSLVEFFFNPEPGEMVSVNEAREKAFEAACVAVTISSLATAEYLVGKTEIGVKFKEIQMDRWLNMRSLIDQVRMDQVTMSIEQYAEALSLEMKGPTVHTGMFVSIVNALAIREPGAPNPTERASKICEDLIHQAKEHLVLQSQLLRDMHAAWTKRQEEKQAKT